MYVFLIERSFLNFSKYANYVISSSLGIFELSVMFHENLPDFTRLMKTDVCNKTTTEIP